MANSPPYAACEAFILGLEKFDLSTLSVHPLRRELMTYQARQSQVGLQRAISAYQASGQFIRADHLEEDIPQILPETISAMEVWQADGTIASLRQLESFLIQDPYLSWLEATAFISFPQGLRFENFWPANSWEVGDGFRVDLSPIGILVAHLRTQGVNRLSPQMALLRVVRDFDPSLTPMTRQLINLNLASEQTRALENLIFERAIRGSLPLVWQLVPNIEAGEQNLAILENLILNHFQRFLSRGYWSLINRLKEESHPVFLDVHYVSVRYTQGQLREEAIDELRAAIDAPEFVSNEAILAAVRFAMSSEKNGAKSYIEFLLSSAPSVSSAFAGQDMLTVYRQVRSLLALARAMRAGKLIDLIRADPPQAGIFY